MPGEVADLIAPTDPDGRKKLKTRSLARQTSQLAWISGKLALRMQHWLKLTETDKATGAGPLPDEDWRETYKVYADSVLGLLKEQRERQKLANAAIKSGTAAVLSSGEYEAELLSLARETIRGMPEEELQALIAERSKP